MPRKRYICSESRFQNMNPERGRKPEQDAAVEDAITAISEHEPRKGTETPSEIRPCTSWENFRTRTPKGDGNTTMMRRIATSYDISEHEPRKGTETPQTCNESTKRVLISEHEPRKGTETLPTCRLSVLHARISEHEPRKGTETFSAAALIASFASLFQNVNPERGRNRL